VRIFLSYRRDDASGHAGRLYDLLANRYGAEHVFMDVDAIPLGSDFAATIKRAVAACDVLIAVIGRDWLRATDADGRRRLDDPHDYVRLEIESALERGVAVVPTCVQGAVIPSGQDLPASLAPLIQRQGFQLTDSGWPDDVGRLIRRLEAVKAEQAHGVQRRRRRPRRRILAAVLAGCLAAGGIALALALRSPGDEPSTAAEQRLLAMIPRTTRPDCQRESSPEPTAEASLTCGVATLQATYHLFSDRALADASFVKTRAGAGVDINTGTCKPNDFRGQTDFSVGGRAAGEYYCFVSPADQPSLVAIDHRTNVVIAADVYHGSGRTAIDKLLELWACCVRVAP
jgi:hypothetical protein